ncbi:AAA family ATPase [Pseudomonas sp. RTC3]|uniref:AAA family ATPase n=1 Tax=Pseudomonas sp. 5C2 TaxID=3048588 RepID=UPI002AB4EA5B|nr:AAA family ATPase [Pseudomonas sp. 5C2]MDY7568113.1 AAA family ATPase [Pseudomonas sp. 5C2]MEB0060425.1 AAA family ATPase [Pseudomonas sp. RTC3]MEB0242716.1 AAA family ATPase [Pseudomonas sp. 5C2]
MTTSKSMATAQADSRRQLTKECRENLYPDNIPAELKAITTWVVWEWGKPKGNGKFHKPPRYPKTGKLRASAEDPSDADNLGTFDEAIAAFDANKNYAGIGIAISSSLGLVALDFDNCVDELGGITGDVSQLVDLTYAEFSPSQKGIRAFYKGEAEHKKGKRLEIFTEGGYVTVTGHVIKNAFDDDIDGRLPPLEPELRHRLERMAGSRGDAKATDDDDCLAGIDNDFPETPANIERLKSALRAIPADCGYEEWVKTIFAIKTTGWDCARDMAVEWSKTAPDPFNEDDFKSAWRSGKDTQGGVTVAYVFGRAKENDWLDPRKRHTDIDALVAAMTPQVVGEYGSKPPYRWLIKRLLPRLGISMIYGDSTAGKTFVAIDMAMAIARGVPTWCGRKVAQGKVVFVAAEDAAGVELRYHAYLKNAGIRESDLDRQFTVICQAPNLLDDNHVLALIKGIRQADLIIVDTLASVMPGGDENTSQGMGMLISSAQRIAMETGSVVLLIHHSGKNQAAGPRGWSGSRGGVDALFCITQDKDGKTRLIEAAKIKNGVQGEKFAFMLQQVDLGLDDDGEVESSCVVAFLDSVPATVREERVPRGVNLEAVYKIIKEHTALKESEFVRLGVDALPRGDGPKDKRRDVVRRAITGLKNKNFIEKGTDGLYRLSKTYYPKPAIDDGDEPFDDLTVHEGDDL